MLDGDDAQNGTPRDDEGEEEDAATPAPDDEEEPESSPRITSIPRRRRGRGGARQSSRRDGAENDDGDDTGDAGTPVRRKRGRPFGSTTGRGRGGFRGRRRGAQPEAPKVVDKDGTVLDVLNDEAIVDDDEEGNEKVDELGNLQGGRQYRVRTFTIRGRGDRLYMLSTEPARCCGFRDSYLFFAKHPKLYKVLLNEEEKKDLIEHDILPSSYKGRNIGVATARSVFREFGARIIVAGKRVTDDYKVAEARANGDVEGELADPEDRVPDDQGAYNRNRYVAWFGASEVYRNTGQSGAAQPGKQNFAGRKKNNLTVQNWQSVHSREARYVYQLSRPCEVELMSISSRSNSAMTELRRANLNGIYDTHTNMMFYPKIMQPTHAKWEQIPPPIPPAEAEQKQLTNGLTNGHHPPNGTTTDDAMEVEEVPNPNSQEPSSPTLFSEVPQTISRNYAVIDTVYTSAPISNSGYPGPDGRIEDCASGTNGLSAIPDDLVAELPEDCRRAFEEAKARERGWKGQWGTEARSGLRGGLKIGFSGYPV